jgi:cytochrome b pre-mRNA-processing protein 3
MIFRLFRRDPQAASITALYGAIVAQARHPGFYLDFGVPDTPEGRFDMIALHLALVCRRLGRPEEAEQGPARALSQAVFDMFCQDMDHNLREMGVTDLGVPKKMQKLGEAFYGRLDAYDRALAAAGDTELAAALGRNVLVEGAPATAPSRLAAYVRAVADRLAASAVADLGSGKLSFPDPASIAAADCEARA